MSATDPLPLAAWTRAVRPSTIGEMLVLMARPGVISFALGNPAPDLFPRDEYLAAADRVLSRDPSALQYGPPSAVLKEQVVEVMKRRGVRCRPGQVFLTTGAQQALALLARVLLEPGGPIVCERLVYMGFQAAVEPFSPRVLAVGTDLQTGIDVDAVEAHLARGERPAFLYVITDGHNPLGVSVSLEKRVRLAELARQYRVPLIEDDAYGMLHLEEPVLPIRSLEDRWVLYVGSFSKVLSPAFRVGWCVVPEELVPLLGAVKDGLDVDTASFTQRLVSEYLSAGGFPAHLARARAAYRERRDHMLAALRDEFPAGTRWSVPRNGALLWAELPGGLDAGALLRASLEREMVAFVPGRAFALPGGSGGESSLRLNYSFPTPAQIDDGMRRLGRLARAALG